MRSTPGGPTICAMFTFEGSTPVVSIRLTVSLTARLTPMSTPLTNTPATAVVPVSRGVPSTQRPVTSERAACTRTRSSVGSCWAGSRAWRAGRRSSVMAPVGSGTLIAWNWSKFGRGSGIGRFGSDITRRSVRPPAAYAVCAAGAACAGPQPRLGAERRDRQRERQRRRRVRPGDRRPARRLAEVGRDRRLPRARQQRARERGRLARPALGRGRAGCGEQYRGEDGGGEGGEAGAARRRHASPCITPAGRRCRPA